MLRSGLKLKRTGYRLMRLYLGDEELTEYLQMEVASVRELIVLAASLSLVSTLLTHVILTGLGVGIYTSLFLSLSAGLLIVFAAPKIYKLLVKDLYGRWLAREEPIAIMLFTLYSRRLSIERIIQTLNNSHIEKVIPRTLRFLRYVLAKSFVSREPIENIMMAKLGLIPYDGLRRYLFNILRIRSLGGDIHNYSTQVLLDLYTGLRQRWTRMWSSITGYLEGVILIYGLFPTILSSLVFVLGYNTTLSIFTAMMISYPVFTFLIYLAFDRFNVHDPIETEHRISKATLILIPFIPVLGYYLIYRLGFDPHLMISLLLTLILIPTFIIQLKELYREVREESGLVSLSLQLSNLLDGGFQVVEALKRLNLSGLPKGLAEEIRRLRYLLDRGVDIRGVEGGGKAYRLFRIAVSESIVSGGGSAELATLRELLTSFLEVSRLKRLAFITALASAVIVVFLGGYSLKIVTSIIYSVEEDLSHIFISGSIDALYSYAKTFILMGTLYMGLLLGKLIFGGFRNVLALTPLLASAALVYLLIL